jgi:seryl-tRNA(Sec) selenium transferase
VPHQGFGRAMKVGREEIVGLLVALQRFAAGSDEADFARWSRLLDGIEETLRDVPGICLSRSANRGGGVPLLAIDLAGDDPADVAYAVVNALLDGEPRIAIGESHAERGRLTVNPQSLTDDEAEIVAGRLRAVFGR